MEKVSLPKGTRDFGPAQMAKRQFIIDSIKKVFQTYGFQPLETPAMENLSTLQGKYGDEGDQLLFKVLDSGEFFQKLHGHSEIVDDRHIFMRGLERALRQLCGLIFQAFDDSQIRQWGLIQNLIESDKIDYALLGIHLDSTKKELLKKFIQAESVVTSINLAQFFIDAQLYHQNFEASIDRKFQQFIDKVLIKGYGNILENFILSNLSSKKVASIISEKGLRYDLTVPFARYVVMNRHEITFPFKRYQIQPVWRADRPQASRYREFYQCDADVVGTDSLVCEAEIILMIKDAFKALRISDYSIKVNHRAILSGLAEICRAEDEGALFVAIDKLDKVGEEKVKEELKAKGFSDENLSLLFEVLNFKGTTQAKIDFLSSRFSNSEKGKKGISDFTEVLKLLKGFGANEDHVEFDVALARGLSYYTGCIFEVKIHNVGIGSVSGGGRYDNLTAVFDAKEKSSGVGFSFGIDRIYDAMEKLNIFPKEASAASRVLIAHLDHESLEYGLKVSAAFRERGIACEIYPDEAKVKKQMEYANKKKIPFVVVIGSDEIKTGMLSMKKMETGDQVKSSLSELINVVLSSQ